MTASAHLEVGYVARVRGLQGDVVVRTFDPASQAFAQVKRALLRMKTGGLVEREIAHSSPIPRGWVVGFAGVEDRLAGEELIGARVLVFRADLEPPAEGEYFQGDLVGLAAFSESGDSLGTVEEVWNTGPVATLVIRREGEELLVPFVDDFVPEVDMENRRVVLRPPVLFE